MVCDRQMDGQTDEQMEKYIEVGAPPKNLITGRVRECIFRVPIDTNLENLAAWCHSWWYIRGFDVCTNLPKKLWNHHW